MMGEENLTRGYQTGDNRGHGTTGLTSDIGGTGNRGLDTNTGLGSGGAASGGEWRKHDMTGDNKTAESFGTTGLTGSTGAHGTHQHQHEDRNAPGFMDKLKG
jgi:hypothetical protein